MKPASGASAGTPTTRVPVCSLHPVLTVDAGNGGVVRAARLRRAEPQPAVRSLTTKKRAADDKESRRWLHGAEIAGDRLTQAAMITMVGDRESDIYDLFARRPAVMCICCAARRIHAP